MPGNQIVARHGSGTNGRSLLVQVYTPVQHHNLMDDPWSGKVASGAAWGRDEPCVFGMGVGQNKSHQAIALAILKLLADTGTELPGTLYVAINNEGRSSHKCSEAILAALDAKPDFALLMTATGRADFHGQSRPGRRERHGARQGGPFERAGYRAERYRRARGRS